VDLKVLQRHASSLGAQLGLVTRTRHVREDAEALGIPVFESAGEAQRVAWPSPGRRRLPWHAPVKNLRGKREQASVKEEAWRSNPFTRLSAFTIGVVSVFALVSLFIPSAQVTLSHVTKLQSIALPVVASESVESVFVTGSIPAREKRIVLDGMQTVNVTGEGVIPQSKARGVVLFRNLTQEAVTIPSGTIVEAARDALVRFVTLENGVVDAGVGKTIELPVEAMEGGLAGNLPAETLIVIDGRLGLSLSVTNLEPTAGGRELSSVQASDADRARAKDLLTSFLDDEARLTYLNELNSGDILFENTISVSQTLLEEYDPPAGAASSRLTLTMQVEYSARYASASDLTELASLALNASLPLGFSPASEAVTVEPVTTPALDDSGSARWQIRAEREIVRFIDAASVTYLIRGTSLQTAQTRLDDAFPLDRSPEIKLSPSWWQWIPLLPFRIEVVTE